MSSKASLILKSSGFRVLQTVIGMMIGLLMMPFLISTLGQEQYGLWIVIGSVVGTYYLLDLGFNQAVTRYVSKYIHQNNPEDANRIINTALVIYSLLGVLVLLISIVAAHYGAEKLMEDKSDLDLVMILLVISGLSLAMEFPAKAFPGIISAYMRYDFIALVRLVKSIIDALLVYIFLSNGYGLIAMATITFVTGLISTAVYIRFTTSLFKSLEYKINLVEWGTVKEVFHFSKWVFVMDINAMLRNKMDIWFIAFFQSSGVLTVYYVAIRLVEYAVSFLTQATGFSTPIFTEHHAKGEREKLILSLSLFVKFNVLLGFVFLGGFYLLGHSFIQNWMGDNFPAYDAYLCLLIVAAGRLAVYFSAPFQSILMTVNRHNFSAWVSIAETISIVVLLYFLVPTHSIVGASIAVSLPLIIGRILIIPYFGSRIISLDLKKIVVRIVFFVSISVFSWWVCMESLYFLSMDFLEIMLISPVITLLQLAIGILLFTPEEKAIIVLEIKKRFKWLG